MTETNKAKFFQSTFQFEFENHVFELMGMFSDYGIGKLQLLSRPPPHFDVAFGHTAMIRLGGLSLSGFLTKQFTELGTSYEIRFCPLTESQKRVLKARIEAEGVHPGWQRKYPRISVKEALQLGLPALNFCVMRFLGAQNFSSVLNFTLDGIRVEVTGEEMIDARVGALANFDLMTNTGIVIAGLSGEIRNISLNEYEEDGKKKSHKSLGIKLQGLSLDQKQKYSNLIREHCAASQKRLAG